MIDHSTDYLKKNELEKPKNSHCFHYTHAQRYKTYTQLP